MVIDSENILLVGGLILATSIFVSKAGYRVGMPALLLFLGVGMLFGSDGVGIQFNSPNVAQFIGVLALSVILFSGGMDTKIQEIRPVMAQGVVLATVGVVATAALTGGFIYFITNSLSGMPSLNIAESLLLASVMSSTDSASVFSILRSKKMGLKENLRPTLELESGSNDPMAYMLTLLLIQIIQTGEMSIWDSLGFLGIQLVVGAIAGYALGKVTVFIVNKINIENSSLYPILLLAMVYVIFSVTSLLQGNGYLAVYLAGLVVGNHKLVHKKSIGTFFDGLAWLFQIVMFLALGLLVNPHELLSVTLLGLLVGVFMILFGRPLSVFLCLAPFRKMSLLAKTYVSWVGLRGAVPIIFATYPWIAGIPHANLIFNVVFFITIVSLLVQGTTVGFVAKMLGLATEKEGESQFGVEFSDEIKASMSEIRVVDSVIANGDRLMDMKFPSSTLVVMVRRGEKYFVPTGETHVLINDVLLVISDNEDELKQTYENLGLGGYYMRQRSF